MDAMELSRYACTPTWRIISLRFFDLCILAGNSRVPCSHRSWPLPPCGTSSHIASLFPRHTESLHHFAGSRRTVRHHLAGKQPEALQIRFLMLVNRQVSVQVHHLT